MVRHCHGINTRSSNRLRQWRQRCRVAPTAAVAVAAAPLQLLMRSALAAVSIFKQAAIGFSVTAASVMTAACLSAASVRPGTSRRYVVETLLQR